MNTNFNSIKVRLKHSAGEAYTIPSSLFQFHKGTIKTRTLIIFLPLVLKFQFHKGTIKTSLSISIVAISLISIP